MEKIIYYGDINCQKDSCKNRAYYKCEGLYVCGVHCRSKTDVRVELPKRKPLEVTKFKQERQNREQVIIENARRNNSMRGRSGQVILSRMFMMKEPEYKEGYVKVFPNYRHQLRIDGFGCSRLSPMVLGKVVHGQPGLPDALNLENFHQGNKVFPEEVDANNNPTQLFYDNRLKFYLDSVPHRHKYTKDKKPLYSIFIDSTGKEHRLSYIESRELYCTFYFRLAVNEPDFLILRSRLQDGYNLQICGYDAYEISEDSKDAIENAYLDPQYPFGHERVIYTMLVLMPRDFPWIKHRKLV